MKGIAGTVLRLLYVSALQRWLLAIGLVLTLFGIFAQLGGWHPAAQPLFSIAALLGIMTAVVSPVVVDPMLFRALSAPRSIQLIPHGRLKLLLGVFCAQLLLAVFIGTAFGALVAIGVQPPPHGGGTTSALVGTTCVLAFAALTLFFVIFSWTLQYRLAAIVWLPFVVGPRLLSFAFPRLHAAALTTPRGLAIVLMASLLAWLLFAVTYARTGHINRPLWNTVGLGSVPKRTSSPHASIPREPQYRRREAIRILLTGSAHVRRTSVLIVLGIGALSILLTLLTMAARADKAPLMWPFITCLFAGLVPGIFAIVIARRAKYLWLITGMGRAELFATIETECWWMITLTAGAAMIMAIPLLAFWIHTDPLNAQALEVLAVPFAAGSAFVYVSLLTVRGNRLADNLVLAGNAVLLFAEMVSAESHSQLLPALICLQIILVPLLREVARRRWNNIDWLLIRQPLPAARWA